MDIKKLETIMKLMRKHQVSELSIEDKENGEKLHLTGYYGTGYAMPGHMPAMLPPIPMPSMEFGGPGEYTGEAPAPTPGSGAGELKLKPNQHVVRSPFVGTFYASPSPGAEAFVKVGQKVKKGDVLCIVEAMKLMNEIEADADGLVVEVLVQNGQPVEYNQPIVILE